MGKMKMMQTEWDGGWHSGVAVIHDGRNAHVVSAPPQVVPPNEVPILYDDESGCCAIVSAVELRERFPSPKSAVERSTRTVLH